MRLNINHLRDKGKYSFTSWATLTFYLKQPDDSFFIWKGGGGEVFPKMTLMGRLRPLDRPFPGFRFFKGLRNPSVWYSKVGLKGAQIFLWKLYDKDASSTVVRVNKGSDPKGNFVVLNFLEHPRFWYCREQFPSGIASLPLFSSNILYGRCSKPYGSCLTQEKN